MIYLDVKEIRIPQQKRSIEKKEKIIEAAYRIFMEKGYYGTNTADIAKEAGLSTGSVYAYFSDKKDILLSCLYRYGDELTKDLCEKIQKLSASEDIYHLTKSLIQLFIQSYGCPKQLHDEIMSLQYRDYDVKKYFNHQAKTMMSALSEQLKNCGYVFNNEREQTLLLFHMLTGVEDKLLFDPNPDINPDTLIDACAHIIVAMLSRKDCS